jgi:hypothetical protein
MIFVIVKDSFKMPVQINISGQSVESTEEVLITRTCHLSWEFSYAVPVLLLPQITLGTLGTPGREEKKSGGVKSIRRHIISPRLKYNSTVLLLIRFIAFQFLSLLSLTTTIIVFKLLSLLSLVSFHYAGSGSRKTV